MLSDGERVNRVLVVFSHPGEEGQTMVASPLAPLWVADPEVAKRNREESQSEGETASDRA